MKAKDTTILIMLLLVLSSCDWTKNKTNTANEPTTLLASLDSNLIENSGIIYWDHLIWTFNDSGGKPEIYGFKPKTGEIVKTIRVSNAGNVDWEDIAQDEQFIYIAEFGNNVGNRKDLQVLKIEKSQISKEIFQQVNVQKINFNYANQKSFLHPYKGHGFDAEALAAINGNLYLFTKDWKDNITTVYRIPNQPGNHTVSPKESFNVKGLITGADVSSKGKLALIGYVDFKSFAWVFEPNKESLFSNPTYVDLTMLENAQTEGICFSPKGDLLISCEQTTSYPPKIWKVKKSQFQ